MELRIAIMFYRLSYAIFFGVYTTNHLCYLGKKNDTLDQQIVKVLRNSKCQPTSTGQNSVGFSWHM